MRCDVYLHTCERGITGACAPPRTPSSGPFLRVESPTRGSAIFLAEIAFIPPLIKPRRQHPLSFFTLFQAPMLVLRPLLEIEASGIPPVVRRDCPPPRSPLLNPTSLICPGPPVRRKEGDCFSAASFPLPPRVSSPFPFVSLFTPQAVVRVQVSKSAQLSPKPFPPSFCHVGIFLLTLRPCVALEGQPRIGRISAPDPRLGSSIAAFDFFMLRRRFRP